MERARIKARVLTSYYRPKRGGFCKRYFQVIRALLAAGHEVHYLAVAPFPIEHDRCHFHRFPWPRDHTENVLFWAIFHCLAPFFLLFLSIRWKISHAFAFGPTYSFCLQPARVLARVPVVLFLRGDTIRAHQIKAKPYWIVRLDTMLEGVAIWGVRVVAVSETLRRRVLDRHRWAHPKSTAVLMNHINGWALRTRSRPAAHRLRLACVGIIEKTKNQQFLIEKVMPALETAHTVLTLYGDGPDVEELRETVGRLQLDASVIFAGWISSELIWPEVDLLVMPSVCEGAPNAMLEALGAGVPVIASDIPEHREILPLMSLYPLDTPETWIESLSRADEDRNAWLETLVREQRTYAERLMFDWERAMENEIVPDRN